ncbi:MAG: glycosyltransferase [Deltaproteobacteria bacterium]|nr:glycosyltransferase [Deltaproteobacteria bacterium]
MPIPHSGEEEKRPVFLTACLVVYHEERLIRRCLKSIRSLCDEIIVIHDGPCSDQTLAIALEFGATAQEGERRGAAEFHLAAAFARARGEWILQLDADEFLSATAVSYLRNRLRRTGQDNGFSLLWPVWNGRRYLTSCWPYKPCIFRKAAMHYVGFLHSEVTVDGGIRPLPVRLEHQPEYNNLSFSTYMKKHRKWVAVHADNLTRELTELPSFRPRQDGRWPTHMEVIRRYGKIALPLNAVILFLGTMFLAGGWRNPCSALLVYKQNLFYYSELAWLYGRNRRRRTTR